MTVGCVVDTSVLARLGATAVREAIDVVIAPKVPSLVALELGFSARSADEWDRIDRALTAFGRLDVEPHHLRRALAVQRLLAERGLRGRKVPDLVVAACAEDHGLELLHYDRDYDHIGSVTGQAVRWVVPAGSID